MTAARDKAVARLQRAAENAKIALSDQPYVTIEEEYLLEKDGRPVNLSVELARNHYEAMIEPCVAETHGSHAYRPERCRIDQLGPG